ncbi:DUF928 domain-containing protein [Phormidium tenue FACHB-886]|nr:DUF928 domain-containing protein [Phormidium tenue FACHB-886]
MFYIKSLFRHTSIVLAAELAIAFNLAVAIAPSTAIALHDNGKLSVSQQARKQNVPPPRENPGSSAAGGRRKLGACPQDAGTVTPSSSLTALSPTTKPGLTLAAHPTFLVHVPRTSTETAEFSLRNQMDQGVYRTTIALTNTPDIISITLPDQISPLEVGKQYIWSFAIICNPDDRLADEFVTGTVERTELNPTRLAQIEQTSDRQRIALYQQNGIWYDALALLFELKRNQPTDPAISAAWHEFLRSGGVDTMINTSSARSR